MELTESYLIKQSTDTFLKNFQRYVAQVTARIDTLSSRITEMRDIYNSSMSRRLDEIVRVLTVVTVLFAPGTFIVGIYGMNFQFMPELEQLIALKLKNNKEVYMGLCLSWNNPLYILLFYL